MRTCLITGASRGIGRAIAIELSQREDIQNFVLIARDIEQLKETKRLMNPLKRVDLFSIDFSDIHEVESNMQNIVRDYKNIEILVNNAGYVEPRSLLETSAENWETTFRVNVTSLFLVTREVVKNMKKTGGKIINIASTAGISARPGWLAYAASKAAVINMTSTLSEELKEYGIKVYCVSPGRCATDLRKKLAPDEDPTTIMQPEDVAYTISNLVSPIGDFLDGQNIVVRQQR
jgi:3-oxoacyl-[acyl-carrier protein] reductase